MSYATSHNCPCTTYAVPTMQIDVAIQLLEFFNTQQQALDCAKQQLVVQNAILAQMNTLVKLVQNHQQNAGKPTNASNNAQATPAVEREASYPYGPKNQPPREMEQPPVPMRLI